MKKYIPMVLPQLIDVIKRPQATKTLLENTGKLFYVSVSAQTIPVLIPDIVREREREKTNY